MFFRRRKKFGVIAVKCGFATEEKVQEALDIQKERIDKGQRPKPIGEVLEDMDVLTGEEVGRVLKEQQGFLLYWIYTMFNIKR